MKKTHYILSVVLLLYSFQAFSQDKLKINCFIENLTRDAIEGARAEIYEGSTKVNTVTSDTRGKISFDLDYNKNYKVVFTKSGMIQKRLDFNTALTPENQRNFVKEMGVLLVQDCSGADVSVFKEPADKIKFDDKLGNFDSDRAYVDNMQSRFMKAYQSLEKCQQDKFDEKKQAADQQFAQGNFEAAVALYEEALKVFPNDGSVKRQISQAKKSLANKQEDEQRYEQLKKDGDALLAQNNLDGAKQQYLAAQKLKPNDSYTQQKITQINTTIAQQQEALAKQQQTEAEFNSLMKQAGAAMAAENYPLAQEMYQKASAVKPGDALAKQKIAEAQTALQKQQAAAAEQQRIETEFNAAMAEADAAMQQANYALAQQKYTAAIAIMPSSSLPRKKIEEAKKLEQIQKEEAIAAQKAETDRKYNEAINTADQLLAQEKYAEALQAYEQAMQIKPSDTYVNKQIGKINNLIVEQAQAKQAAIEKQYEQAMNTGDARKIEKEFAAAIEAYQQALVAKPNDASAKAKLAESQKLLADKKKLEQEENVRRAGYNELIQKADGFFTSLDYNNARLNYQKALEVYATEQYPKNQIAKIDNIVAKGKKDDQYNQLISEADGFFSQQKWDDAKQKYAAAKLIYPEKTYPQDQINLISKKVNDIAKAEVDAKYNNLVTQAEQEVTNKNYEQAKKLYSEASLVMPENPYPQKRINEINDIATKEARDKVLSEFNALITQADQNTSQKNYGEAKALLKQAQTVMPESELPQQKINEINKLIVNDERSAVEAEFNTYLTQAEAQVTQKNYAQAKQLLAQASQVMPENTYPQKRINEIAELEAAEARNAKFAEFDNLIAQADQLVAQKQYNEAKTALKQAETLDPESKVPQKKINEINKLIDAEAVQNVEEQYSNLIAKADGLFDTQNYTEAKQSYVAASKIKPTEKYPGKRVNEINSILSENARQKVISDYQEAIAVADGLFDQKKYSEATLSYKNAQKIIPEETYPQQRINEINSILAEQAKNSALQAEVEAKYTSAIELADKYFGDKNYPLAIEEYKRAMGIKSGDPYPSQQIAKSNELILQGQQQKAQQEELVRKFNETILLADKQFKDRDYTTAKSTYQTALTYKAGDAHAVSQIQRIDQLLAEKDKEEQKRQQTLAVYNNLISDADKLYGENKLINSKQQYFAALEVIPGQEYPRSQIRKIDEKLRIIAANQAAVTKVTTTTRTSSTTTTPKSTADKSELASLNFVSEKDRQNYLDGLKGKYKEGVTKEVHKNKSGTINRYIVVRDGEVSELREVIFNWGQRQYSVNGKPSNSQYLKSQIKLRDGESFFEAN